jgi:SAM-dependent methyltransferase
MIMSYLTRVKDFSIEGSTIVEIGSGWYPALPVCFSLAGGASCHTVDIRRHFDENLTFRMLRRLDAHIHTLVSHSTRAFVALSDSYRRMLTSRGLGQLLTIANIHYYAPANANALDWLPDSSVDMVYSNSVLEHVTPVDLPKLLRESWRVLKANGVMVHAVACNDHYAHFDSRISFINYLQYSESDWALWNCALNYQNRLRACDFITAAEQSGFEVVYQVRACRPGVKEALATLPLAPEFLRYGAEDLAATSIDFVALKRTSGGMHRERTRGG